MVSRCASGYFSGGNPFFIELKCPVELCGRFSEVGLVVRASLPPKQCHYHPNCSDLISLQVDVLL